MADACAGPAAYHPRRARDSPLDRLTETHHESFKRVCDERFASRYGAWRGVVERMLWAFLDCGIEERGFARVRCAACRREFRVALSCKRRGFCPSCHSKRSVLCPEWLSGEVLAAVPHHRWVFTVPKRLRQFILYDRRLLGALSRCVCHGGEFTPLAAPPTGVAEELFRSFSGPCGSGCVGISGNLPRELEGCARRPRQEGPRSDPGRREGAGDLARARGNPPGPRAGDAHATWRDGIPCRLGGRSLSSVAAPAKRA